MRTRYFISLAITAVLLLSSPALGETLYLSVAASMTDAFREICARFQAAHPGVVLQPNFASSGSLAKQIEQGAPADLYVSANPDWMDYLLDQGSIAPGSKRIFAYNSLVFLGTGEHDDLALENLATLERIALGSPQSVPAGQYARQALEKAGVYRELVRERKLVMAKDVRQALLYADRGEVDGAFVYATDALLARNARVFFTVPGELHEPIAYPLGLTRRGADKALARTFNAFLAGPEALAVLEKFGFRPAARPAGAP